MSPRDTAIQGGQVWLKVAQETGVQAGTTARLSQSLALLLLPPKPTWGPPRLFRGPRAPGERTMAPGKTVRSTLAVPSVWPCPRQHSQGAEPGLQREGARESPPALPALWPPGKALSQQHWKGRQLGFGLKSLASEKGGGKDKWVGAGGGHRNGFVRASHVASTVLCAHSTAPLRGQLLTPLNG